MVWLKNILVALIIEVNDRNHNPVDKLEKDEIEYLAEQYKEKIRTAIISRTTL